MECSGILYDQLLSYSHNVPLAYFHKHLLQNLFPYRIHPSLQNSKTVCSIHLVSHQIMAPARGQFFSFSPRGKIFTQKDQRSDLKKQSPSSYLFHSVPKLKNMFRLLAVYYIQKET